MAANIDDVDDRELLINNDRKEEKEDKDATRLANLRLPNVNAILEKDIPKFWKLRDLEKPVLFPHEKKDRFEAAESLIAFDLTEEGLKKLNIMVYIAWYKYLTKFALCDVTLKNNGCCFRDKSVHHWESFNLCQLLLSILVFPMSITFYVVMLTFWILSILFQLIRRILPFYSKRNTTTLRIIDNCQFTTFIDPKAELDFSLHRGPSYFVNFAIKIPMYFVRWITGGFKYVPLLPDDGIIVAMTMSPIARSLRIKWDEENPKQIESVTLDLNPFIFISPPPNATQITLYPGHHLCVQFAKIDFKKGDIYIAVVNQEGEEIRIHRPKNASHTRATNGSPDDSNGDEELRKWELAKAHLQCVLTWYVPAWTHNWVHFHFLDIAAKWRDSIVTENSVLGTLLAAHLRFTSDINIAGTAEGLFNPQGQYNCCTSITPWKVQPESEQQFAVKVAQNTAAHYLIKDKKTGYPKTIRKDAFPPKFVQERKNPETSKQYRGVIPYLDLCTDYYMVIEWFISKLWLTEISMGNLKASLLEKDMTLQWIQQLETSGMPGLSQIDEITVLTTMIWTGAIVHACDHISYRSIFTHWGMYTSLVPWKDDGHWTDVLQGDFTSTQFEAFKTKSFMDGFVAYNKSWFWANDLLIDEGLYKNWNNVPHKNKRGKLRKLHAQFRKELKKVNEKWKLVLNLNDFAASTSF